MSAQVAGGRWRRRHVGLIVVAVLVVAAMLGTQFWRTERAIVPLYQVGVVREGGGDLVPLSAGRWDATRDQLVGPSRVLPPDPELDAPEYAVGWGLTTARAASDWAWLRRSDLPGAGTEHAGMAVRALLDLRALTGPAGGVGGAVEGALPGAALAGASAAWSYVWPRDAAFVAVAFARAGHGQQALGVLRFVQEQQAADGSMHARYLPDGSGPVPDGRGLQEDGPGWSLWAVGEVLAAQDEGAREEVAKTLEPLITRSTARILARTAPGTGLPLPSPDYWEVPEHDLTLGVAATSLVGLETAAGLVREGLVDPAAWADVGVEAGGLDRRAADLRAALVAEFGPGFPRHAGGVPDAAVTFLLAPFTRCPVPGAAEARLEAVPEMRRPAGGVAPGAGWRLDGVSWTPQTALQALAAAGEGRRKEAKRWLDWLAAHRTEAGSLPEKVLFDGRPAAVAPLAWTSALVLIALDELERTPAPAPGCSGPGEAGSLE